MKITYFVHGTTTDNEKDIATGWRQGKLSALGKRQSTELKRLIKGRKFDVVFCSDLKRSVDSARLTFGKTLPLVVDKRLRECDYGKLTRKSASLVDSMMAACISKPFPKGESYKDAEKRMRSFLKDVSRKYPNGRVAIVAHRAPQLALDVILKGKTWKRAIKEDWRHNKKWKPGWIYKY